MILLISILLGVLAMWRHGLLEKMAAAFAIFAALKLLLWLF